MLKKYKNYLLIIDDYLILPGIILLINIVKDDIKKIINNIYINKKYISVFIKKKKEINIKNLYKIGIICEIIKINKYNNNLTIFLKGILRCKLFNNKIKKIYNNLLYLGYIIPINELVYNNNDIKILSLLMILKEKAIKLLSYDYNNNINIINNIKKINKLNYLIYYYLINIVKIIYYKSIILKYNNIIKQFKILFKYLLFELKKKEISKEIINKVKKKINKQQIEYFLNQQIKAIKEKIGYKEDDDINILIKKSLKINLSKEARSKFNNEILKLKNLNINIQEYYIIKNYLNFLLKLPWNIYSKDNININKTIDILDNNHYGLNNIKDRIIEFISVLKLNKNINSPILCFIGPPGVGKTTLSKSIAKVLNRKFIRISLGGLYDESELRGHRRTYVGAMPGRIIKSIINSGTSNPVILLDEIDKIIKNGYNGNPSLALLEILDPEINNKFYDNYLEIGYDLSKILFIATANNINNINYTLLDRMEVININGYTIEDKINISRKFLIPNLIKKNGLNNIKIIFKKKELELIIINYTNESGIRNLIRNIEKILRYIAKIFIIKKKIIKVVNIKLIKKVLGLSNINKYEIINKPGISIGLAWTGYGGDIIYIESVLLSNGSGNITYTGNIGKIMKESIIIAVKYIKSNYNIFKINYNYFIKYDLHVHIPEGSIPKDGPSAGIAIFTSLISSFLSKPIKNYLAMTGEITLRGKILEVGGIKEKILAAKRLFIKTIILPNKNKYCIDSINKKYLKGLKFYYINNIEDIINIIF
ncbi:MAG: endopeptidase La [Candidatus Shikimatogenerans bostrichidophilus]|nr:MAG: endopeptidase La [Candidatus Shikimatogenerans bostrichidophilus]